LGWTGLAPPDETTDVGLDTASSVTDDLDHTQVEFTGTIDFVEIDIGNAAEEESHEISPEMLYRIAMARQ
jgi:arylsulfatase